MNNNKIKPLPTIYDGRKYRSSTEARWHIYFDLIGLNVFHEREAYNVSGRNYLPDFEVENGTDISNVIKPWFIEVKGTRDDAMGNMDLMREFSEKTKSLVMIVWGDPSINPFPVFLDGESVSPACLSWYAFTKKGWNQPFFNEDAFPVGLDSDCEKLARKARRNRRGELLVF